MLKNVYFNHDGGVDDFVSLLLLLHAPEVNLLGISVIGADSYVEPASAASAKIINRFSKTNISVSSSNSRGIHPFPSSWRNDSFIINSFPILNEYDLKSDILYNLPAHLDIIEKLNNSTEKVTLLFTGPLTDLARALEVQPSIIKKIDKLVWMGGSFLELGNVREPDSDGTPEWNSFWDPESVKAVFDSDIKINMISLESTNNVPLTFDMILNWSKKRNSIGFDFIGTCYALVPNLESFTTNSTYYLWDVLTTLTLLDDQIVTKKQILCDVKTKGKSSGQTFISPTGRPLTWVNAVHKKEFYTLLDDLISKIK